jgi:hypothetical protein
MTSKMPTMLDSLSFPMRQRTAPEKARNNTFFDWPVIRTQPNPCTTVYTSDSTI